MKKLLIIFLFSAALTGSPGSQKLLNPINQKAPSTQEQTDTDFKLNGIDTKKIILMLSETLKDMIQEFPDNKEIEFAFDCTPEELKSIIKMMEFLHDNNIDAINKILKDKNLSQLTTFYNVINFLNIPKLLNLVFKPLRDNIINEVKQDPKSIPSIIRSLNNKDLEKKLNSFFASNPEFLEKILSLNSLVAKTNGFVESIAWSPNSQFLAAATVNSTVNIYTFKNNTLTLLTTLHDHTNSVASMEWSPDGRFLAIGSENKIVSIYTFKNNTFTLLKNFNDHIYSVNIVTWSPDGQFLATLSMDNTVNIYKYENNTFTLLKTFNGCNTYSIDAVAWSSDGQFLATSESSAVEIYTFKNNTLTPRTILNDHTNLVTSIVWSLDGRFLATGSRDNTVNIYKYENNTFTLLKTLNNHTNWISSIAWSPNGQFLATGSGDYTINIYKYENNTFTLLKTLNDLTNWTNSITWSPDGHYFMYSENDSINVYPLMHRTLKRSLEIFTK